SFRSRRILESGELNTWYYFRARQSFLSFMPPTGYHPRVVGPRSPLPPGHFRSSEEYHRILCVFARDLTLLRYLRVKLFLIMSIWEIYGMPRKHKKQGKQKLRRRFNV